MTISLLALELVQLSMARAPAPSNEHAASAAADMLRVSLLQRTQHTQVCQLRAVVWRLQHERSVVALLEVQLDNAAEHILDLEDEREELALVNQMLWRDLNDRAPRPLASTRNRATMLADLYPDTAAHIWTPVTEQN